MATDWLAVRVELTGGRGPELDPPPRRALLVDPSHTFAHLAEAVNAAFALYLVGGAAGDRFGHRRVFTSGVVGFSAASALAGAAPTGPS